MTDVDNLDDLANAIANSSPKIKAYAVAQAAATQSQETDIRETISQLADAITRIEVLENTPTPEPQPQPGTLSWTPPGYPDYVGYERRTISNSQYRHIVPPGSNIDAIFDWTEIITDSGGIDRRVLISGFRNWVIIGAEVHRMATTNIGNGVGIQIDRCNGIGHLEGYKGHGSGLIDAIVATSGPEQGGQPGVDLRIQNCYVRTNAINNAHADGFQIWGDPSSGFNGGIRYLKADRWTIHSTWQGIFLGTRDGCIQGGDLRRVNILGVSPLAGGTHTGMGWIFFKGRLPDIGGFTSLVQLTDCWGDNEIAKWNTYPNMVTPNSQGNDAEGNIKPERASAEGSDATGRFVHWPHANSDVKGKLRIGQPPGGDFVPPASVGVNYVSPGYA